MKRVLPIMHERICPHHSRRQQRHRRCRSRSNRRLPLRHRRRQPRPFPGRTARPQTLGLTDGRDEVGFGYGVCDALNDHSASDVDAGIKKHWPNLTQLQVNAVIGFAVAAFCEQNSGKLNQSPRGNTPFPVVRLSH
jgi:hypothetical protein